MQPRTQILTAHEAVRGKHSFFCLTSKTKVTDCNVQPRETPEEF